jgi:PAS domain S-box-containing protein
MMKYTLYTVGLLSVYLLLGFLFPQVISKALFLLPILITLAMGYIGGWAKGAQAAVMGLFAALLLITAELVPASDLAVRIVSFLVISSSAVYIQFLKDRFESTTDILSDREMELAEMAAIVESSDDAIISKNLNGIIKTWNKGAEKLYGYKAEEIIGESILKLFPEGYEEEEEKILHMMKRGERLDHYETIRKHKDGHVMDVSLTVSPVFNKAGRVIAVSKIARDITQQKKYQRELQRSSERYKTFIENSEAAIWLVEYKTPIDTTLPVKKQIEMMFHEGYTAEANQKTAELFGKEDINDFIGRSTVLISPRTMESDKFLEMFIRQNYSVVDWETSSPDGRYGSVTFKGILEGDKLVRAWAILRDTTAVKKQEEAIRTSQERYKAFIENSDEGIARIEFKTPISTAVPAAKQVDQFFTEGFIAEANEVTAKIMGMPSVKDIINVPIGEIEVRSEGDSRFLKLFIENGYSLNEFESTEKRGDKLLYHSTSMKGIVENGNWIRAWMVRRDITAQKEYLFERERLLQQAEEAKRGLEIVSAEKDRFLANLSHELRTPLVSILGYSAMLLESTKETDAHFKMVQTINKNAKLQVQLIEDLLDLSRIISGKIELTKDFFFIKDWVKDGIDILAQQAEAKGLILYNNTEDCRFYGDKKRLSQVLLNLLSNAVKFTEKGQITVNARCNEDFLTLKVTDTGIGIDPKNFHLLFQPFKQIDSSSTRAKQGLGLGLSIVKNIVELHGGKVTVESKVGEGSEFTVYLPVIQAPEVIEHQDKVHISPSATFEGINILVVEDEPDSAEFIKYLYEQKGAKVTWMESAKKTREHLVQNKYDLYIFDLSMPEEDGISLIKSVRKGGDKTKAVALTAFADTYYETKALESGFDMFLKKPSSLSELLSVIKLIR